MVNGIVLIHFFQFLVSVVKKMFPEFQFHWLIEEIKRNLPIELDFYNEGRNCEMLGRMLSKFPYLKVLSLLTINLHNSTRFKTRCLSYFQHD